MRQINKNPEHAHFISWKNDYTRLHGRDAVYDDLIGTREYFELKKSLLEEQGYICCYCEKEIGRRHGLEDCDIEHFMPRHPDTTELSADECTKCQGAQLTYTNLFVSCKGENADSLDHCNHKKDNWFSFQTCFPPTDPIINGMFGFKLDGKIRVENPLGQEMAKHLNLTSYTLEEQRKATFDSVMEIDFEDEDLLNDRDYMEAVIEDYDNMKDGKYTGFCSMITYCLRKYYMPLIK